MIEIKLLKQFLILCFNLTVLKTQSQPCLESKTDQNITWPTTEKETFSQPLCINEDKLPMVRKCQNGKWESEPKCFSIQPEHYPDCPDGFQQIDDICFIVTPKTVFPPVCPYSNNLPLSSLLQMIINHKILSEPIWLPVTRDFKFGLGFLQWIEASRLYLTEFTDYSYTGDIKTKNCAIFEKNGSKTAVSCNEKYRGFCAYKILASTNNSICLNECGGFQSDYKFKTRCFCIYKRTETDFQRAEFLQPYQNNINFSNMVYSIGLEKKNGKFYWSVNNQEINYTFWSSNLDVNGDYNFGASTPNGWILTSDLQPWVLIEREITEKEPKISLEYNNLKKEITVHVENIEWTQFYDDDPLIICMTNAQDDSFVSILQSSINQQFTFPLIEPYPGWYWCDAFRLTDTQIITTGLVFFPETIKNYEFVAIFKVKIKESINPLSSEVITYLNNMFLQDLFEIIIDNVCFVPRPTEILSLNYENNEMIVNIHLSSDTEFENNLEKLQKTYDKILSEITEKITPQNETVQLVVLSSPVFCNSVTVVNSDSTLTWPTTFANSATYPKEFCFRSDGNLIVSWCTEDFLNGADWILTMSGCKILEPSTVSPQLQEIYNLKDSVSSDDIQKILQIDINKYTALDVYFLGIIYNSFFNNGQNVQLFQEGVANLVAMQQPILLQSQLVSHSGDTTLSMIDNFLWKWDNIKISKANFTFAVMEGNKANGLIVLLENNTKVVKVLAEDCSLEDLIENYHNLEFAILLSSELKARVEKTKKIVFKLYQNNALFQTLDYSTKNIAVVAGVLMNSSISDNQVLPGPVIVAQKYSLNETSTYSCYKWVYELNNIRGFWIFEDQPHSFRNFQICYFWCVAHYALAMNTKENITSELEDLLSAEIAAVDKLIRLANISEKHESFNPADIHLVAKILDLIKNDPSNDLKSLTKLIDNLHKIQRSILYKSQEDHNATNLILDNIGTIARNVKSFDLNTLITTENFAILILKKESNVSGLMLLQSKSSQEYKTIDENFSISDLDIYKNFSTVVYVDPQLKKQLDKDSKIIIKFFSNDVLFNEKQPKHESISKIFGVIFTKTIDYTVPISIFHNISINNYKKDCSFWDFQTNESFWKQDSEAQTLNLIQQCKYFHTSHFALLLLPQNLYFDYDSLDWITTINSAVSLISILLIILTAVIFKKWRRNIGNQILLNFSFSIAFQIVSFYIASTINRHSSTKIYCTVIGVLLHYSLISEFCWMLMIAILQFRRFVLVFAASPNYILLKSCICGWVFPILPVMLALILNNEEYRFSNVGLCYPTGLGLYLGVWLPIAIIGFINFIIFIYIIYNVFHTRVDTIRNGRKDGKHQWRLFVLLFFMLGLTWIFGFLSGFEYGIIFAYLFCFTATLQGFLLFLYFIVFNDTTRNLYIQSFQKLYKNK